MKCLAIGIVLVLLVAACGDNDGQPIFADDATTTTSTIAPATSTTAAPTTTATTQPATTTTAATTTTTTTTTVPAPAFGFFPDGLGVADFGDSDDAVVATLTAMFGAPFRDTGWVDEPICPGPMNRFVDFGVALFDFQVMFTTGNLFAPAGTEHFYSYRYEGATPMPVSPPDLTVGTTVGQLMALYPTVLFDNSPFVAGQIVYSVQGLPGSQGLSGKVSGTDPNAAVVQSVQGGIGCGE